MKDKLQNPPWLKSIDKFLSQYGWFNRSVQICILLLSVSQYSIPLLAAEPAEVTKEVSSAIPSKQSDSERRIKPNKNRLNRVAGDLKMLEMLLNKSSVARAVKVAGEGEGTAQQKDARYYFEKAKQAHEAGDKELAAEYIAKAKKAMFSAGKQTGIKKSHKQKQKKDYEKRVASINALLEALQRINGEKNQAGNGKQTEQQIKQQLAKAEEVYSTGDLDQAIQLASSALMLAKQSVINLRDGDTLVRSLNFANKEEEYKYELDRNNTHNMLVTVLLKEKMSNPKVAKRVNDKMATAKDLRKQAEAEAEKGEFEQAVKTLENATKQIIHAIRAAGIYIPG